MRYQSKRSTLLSLILVVICAGYSAASDADLYFYIQEGVPRCFAEELPGETIVIADYKHPDAETKPLTVRIFNNEDTVLLEKALVLDGRFAYHAMAPGEHRICFESSEPWPAASKTAKFHLKIEIQGKDAVVQEDVVRKTHIVDLQQEVQTLKNQIDLILEELKYAKEQETHFNNQSERLNARVMWWSMLQTSLLLISGFWQVAHLKTFFKAKKLV